VEKENGPIGYLHIFAQHSWHDEARVIGTRDALEYLSAAIAQALKHGDGMTATVFTNDGEGYNVEVECVAHVGDDIPTPYTMRIADEEAAHWRERAFNAEAELSRLRRVTSEGAKP
jgi:hypothetical protein